MAFLPEKKPKKKKSSGIEAAVKTTAVVRDDFWTVNCGGKKINAAERKPEIFRTGLVYSGTAAIGIFIPFAFAKAIASS